MTHAVTVRDSGDGPVVALTGEVDQSAVTGIEHAVRAAISDATSWTLDLSSVTYLDSSGLRLLLDLDNAARVEGATVTFRPPKSPMARRALEITGLEHRLGWE